MKRGLLGRLLGGSSLLALVVAAAFAILLTALSEVRESDRVADRARHVQTAATALELLVIELQTGSRGFVISGDERFLQPWSAAKTKIPAQQEELQRLITDPQQERRAAEIVRAIDSYLVDFSNPLVATARRDLAGARATVAAGGGKRLVDRLRQQFRQFAQAETALSRAREERADTAAQRAVTFGVAGLVGSVMIVFLFAAYLGRVIVRPVRRVAAASLRLSEGDLSARVQEQHAGHEIAELGRAFNAMASGIEESQSELESQNVELETQTIELETQAAELEERQEQLTEANDELAAQRSELERAVGDLGEEKARIEAFYRFAEHLAEETEVDALSALVLDRVAELAAAELGIARVLDRDGVFATAATRGVDPDRIPSVEHGMGLAGRALAEGRAVSGEHGEAGFEIETFGERARIRRELHVPLVHANRPLGVISLGRLADREFSAGERETIEHLADQASVALASALALREVRRLAEVNRAVLDATTDAIAMVDLDGRTVTMNAAMRQMVSSAPLADDAPIWESAAALGERTNDPAAYQQAFDQLRTDPKREAVDVYQLIESGTWIQRYSGPVIGTAGDVVGRIFVVRNITAEREAQQLKSDVVATVSHELRTPLTGILGFAELLATNDVDDESRHTYVETIQREAQRLRDLINDFLDLQRIEDGSFRLRLEPVALDEVVREQAALFESHSAAHTIELELDASIDVLGERDRIAQVLANLLSNAIKYSPEGGTVRVAARGVSAIARVEVTDPGIGIPPAQQRRIFEKFFRVDSSDTRRIGGTGLGLALSRDIVEAHGGTIGFSSAEGLGSTFWFELPRVEQEAAVDVPAFRPRVLIVGDNAGTTELLREHLAEDGYEVEVALTGEEALERVAQSPPAVICLDIGLSGALDGWEILTRLKSDPATASIPVLVCTEREDRALALGAADFLTKPFSRERLLDVVARLVPEGRGSILVVDDERTIRQLVMTTLASTGLELHEAANGEEALHRIADRRPDVIVLDLAMPVLDGFGVLEHLLEDPETRAIPVIVLTAKNVSVDERLQLRDRAVTVLEKSAYSAQELRRLVQQAADLNGGRTAGSDRHLDLRS